MVILINSRATSKRIGGCVYAGSFFYIYFKKEMADFNHWDIVVSKNNGKYIEAEVDFQQWDSIYISEWWKSLKCPIRYVIPAANVVKKSGNKIQISLLEMNDLMYKVLWLKGQNYNNEPDFEHLTEGQEFYHSSKTYRYVWEMKWEPVRDCDWYFCTIDKNDLTKLVWTREDVCKAIFWVSAEEVEVI